MAEYVCGFEFIREPDALLPEGSIVNSHKHNFHHNTHLTMGLWEVRRFLPIVGNDGVHTVGNDGELLWHEMPLMTMQGGGPRTVVGIPANMKHEFRLIKGWGFYRCVFAHRDADGNYVEDDQGYAHGRC